MHYLREAIFAPVRLRLESHAATICALPDGALMAAWYAGTDAGAKGAAIFGARKPPDDAWGPPVLIADTPGLSEGNPVLYCDAAGALWLFYVTLVADRWDTSQVKYRRSTDEGLTWGDPLLLRSEWGWTTGSKPLTLADGAILLPLYEVRGAAFVLRSEDGGRRWQRSDSVETPHGVLQSALAPLPDGRILMLLPSVAHADGALWQSFSEDGGMAWTAVTRAPLPNPSARVDVQALPSGALLLAFNDPLQGRAPLTLALSDDQGRTWPIRFPVEPDPDELFSPALAQSSDGLCHLVCTHQRVHIAHIAFDEEWLHRGAFRAAC